MKREKKLKLIISVAVILLLVTGAMAVGKKWWWPASRTVAEKDDDYETVSVMSEQAIGEPTTDDPWAEMEKLIRVYYSENQFVSYKGVMRLFDDNEEKQRIIEEMRFEYNLRGRQYHYRLGQLECIKKDNFFLLADHDNKSIALSSVTLTEQKPAGLPGIKDLKKVLEQKSEEVKITQTADSKVLTVNNIQDPSIQGYQVFYDPVSYRIKKILLGMIRLSPLQETITGSGNQDASDIQENTSSQDGLEAYAYYLEIKFDNTEVRAAGNETFKPEDKFIQFINNKAELQPAYSGYRLLN